MDIYKLIFQGACHRFLISLLGRKIIIIPITQAYWAQLLFSVYI